MWRISRKYGLGDNRYRIIVSFSSPAAFDCAVGTDFVRIWAKHKKNKHYENKY